MTKAQGVSSNCWFTWNQLFDAACEVNVKVEGSNTKHGSLVEVKLEPGLPPKVGRLEDGRRGSDEGGKRKLTGCR